MTKTIESVAVLGGTGKEGSGLAFRWAHAGYQVVIGSRTEEKALTVAAELNDLLGEVRITGMANDDAAVECEVSVLTVPYSAHGPTVESVTDALKGKILIDVTVPGPPGMTVVDIPPGRTAAQEAQTILGEDVRVVSAFQNISASHLKKLEHDLDSDVLVTGDDEEAKLKAIELVDALGMRGIDAGPLANAAAAESLTPVLISIGKKYKVRGAGIRITGL